MMFKRELADLLTFMPDDAIIYIEADHGQQSEQAGSINVCYEEYDEFPYYGEDMEWEGFDTDTDVMSKITAIRIS